MYDRQTESLWQQITGEAILGTLTGEQLKTLPAETVSFQTLSAQFPEAKVLSRDTGYRRSYGQNPYVDYESSNRLIFPVKSPKPSVPLKERIVAITEGGKTKAYPFSWLRKIRVIEDVIESKPYVVFFQSGMRSALDAANIADSKDAGAVGVFSPELEGRALSFEESNGTVLDRQTGSHWNVLGVATTGRLSGSRLTPVEHTVAFAFAWLAFRPETEIVGSKQGRSARQ